MKSKPKSNGRNICSFLLSKCISYSLSKLSTLNTYNFQITSNNKEKTSRIGVAIALNNRDKLQKFSIRKYAIGTFSTVIATLVFMGINTNHASADELNQNQKLIKQLNQTDDDDSNTHSQEIENNKLLGGRLNRDVHQLVKIKQMHDCRINSKTLMKHRNNYLQMFRMIVSINRIMKQI